MQKIFKIVLIILSVAGVIFWILLPSEDVPANEAIGDTNVNMMFYISYILLAIPVVALLYYSVINLLASPAKLKKALIGIGGFAVIIILSYALSSGTDVDLERFSTPEEVVTESDSKWIGAGLNAFYILTIVAIGAMLFGGVKKILNK